MGGVNFGTYEPTRDKLQSDKSIIVNIFFDGTLNNRSNTRSRVANERRSNGLPYNQADNPDGFIQAEGEDTSYYNDESNVSRLEEYIIQDQQEVFSIYTEGIGTLDYGEDQQDGYAYGSRNRGAFDSNDDTGVLGKVKIGCDKILEKIQKSIKKSKTVDFTFNVFGFSRGAAAARNFVHEVGFVNMREDDNDEQQPHGHLGVSFSTLPQTIGNVIVNFVGLYDTVSSYQPLGMGQWIDVSPNFENDVGELNLNSLGAANYTLHLTAENELRENFSLTNINSARKGKTIELPGVHSDIGGGYIDSMDENGILLYDIYDWSNDPIIAERQRYIDEGWYLEDEIIIDYSGRNEIYGYRTNLSNKYSFIPLRYMMQFAKSEGKIEFKEVKLERDFPLDTFLTSVKTRLDSYVKGGNGLVLTSGNTFTAKQLADHVMLKELRNKYLHISHHYKNTAGVAEPMAPREGGRLIIPG
ncbi:phospholipase effector Tle1 domain-containing protein [Aquimarina rhabdastrellae]